MIKRICLMLLVTFFMPAAAGAYPYNQPHTFQSQLESARMKTVSIKTARIDTYTWQTFFNPLTTGTGTMIGDGLILTNAHVIHEEQNDITIKTYTGEVYTGTLLMVDKSIDLALVRFDSQAEGFALSTSELYKGKPVMTVGQPTGLPQWSFSEGTVQTPVQEYKGDQNESYTGIRTDAQAIKGNSGGPLIDAEGKLIGVIRATDGVYSYAITMKEIKTFLKQALLY